VARRRKNLIEKEPCDVCYYKHVCDHVLSDDCPQDVKKEFPKIWDEKGKLREEEDDPSYENERQMWDSFPHPISDRWGF